MLIRNNIFFGAEPSKRQQKQDRQTKALQKGRAANTQSKMNAQLRQNSFVSGTDKPADSSTLDLLTPEERRTKTQALKGQLAAFDALFTTKK